MNYKERIENNYSQIIDKSGKVINGLNNAIADVLNDAKTFCNFVSNTTNVDKLKNDTSTNNKRSIGEIMLYYLASFFCMDEMLNYQKDSLASKIKLLFNRGTTIWGSIPDILNTIRKYFNMNTVYLLENVDDIRNNLMDGEFDYTEKGSWTYSSNAGVSSEAAFVSSLGVFLNVNPAAKATYTIELDQGNYYLHFFAKKVNSSNNGLKLIVTTPEETNTSTTFNIYSNSAKINEWNNYNVNFNLSKKQTVQFEFIQISESYKTVKGVYLDTMQLYKYVGYPTFQVLALFEGGYSNKTFDFANSYEAEIGNTYFEGAKVVGIKSELEFIVDYLRPVGVKAYINYLYNTKYKIDDYVSQNTLYTFSGNVSDDTYNSTDNKSVNDGIYDTNV